MGTTCEIVRAEGGSIKQIHISYDGYLSGVGFKLFRHYDTPEKVRELFSRKTSAPSLEPEPRDMRWSDWDKTYEAMPVEEYLDKERRCRAHYNVPKNREGGKKLVEAIRETGLVGDLVNLDTDVRHMPETLRIRLPDLIEETFGKRLPDTFFAYGSVDYLADHASVPADYDGDLDKGYGLCYIYAHDKWAYPHTVKDMRRFIETGESDHLLTRELFIESDEMDEENFDKAMGATPARPINEMIGILTVEPDGSPVLTHKGERYALGAAPGFQSRYEPEEVDGRKVRISYDAMGVSVDHEGSRSWVSISELELVQ